MSKYVKAKQLPLRTIRDSRQNSVISSSEELKSRAQTGVEDKGALIYKEC